MSNLEQKFSGSVSMVAWAFNEEGLIEDFLRRSVVLLEANVEDWELVVVDDASTDRTPAILAEFARQEPRLRVVTHARNLNVGMACRTAVGAAGKQYLFWQTVDWSYDLNQLRRFLELLRYYDVVQGVRPWKMGRLSGIPLLRSFYRIGNRSDTIRKAIVSLSNYYMVRLLYGVPFHDFQNVTFYPTQLAQSLDLVGRTSFLNPEMLIKAHSRGARFIEVPISFIPRTAGSPKGTKLKTIIRSVNDILANWLRWGWRLRFGAAKGTIHRVSDPFQLEPEVLQCVLPLLKSFG